jgi:PilZ domain/Flagellar protein YcgR
MTDYKKLVDKRWIAIGKALPFSIYDSQRKLLLAQGHVVESQRSLERLQEQGQYYKPEHPDADDRAVVEEAADSDPVDPLTALNRDYANISQRARCGVKIAPRETGESYFCWVIGVSQENRGLVMTAPARSDKALAAISKGQVWFCRMFSSTSVFRFRGAILKVAFDPYPYLHILVPEVIEKRLIRQLPRALVSLQATLTVPESHFASVVDLSVGGARIAVDKTLELDVGHPLHLNVTIEVLGRAQELCLKAKVAVVYGMIDTRHPGIAFYGLSFEGLDERITFLLHGYVQQQIASEYDGLGQILARNAGAAP